MLAIRVETDHGPSYERPALSLLSDLVGRLGTTGGQFLILERIPNEPDVYLQVWYDGDDDYQLEHRAGSHERHFQAFIPTAAEVVHLMTLWARQEKAWDLGPAWERLDLPS
ncbi:hypothetical protein ACWGDE_28785 [Streptomyces sp. NPDC054956]